MNNKIQAQLRRETVVKTGAFVSVIVAATVALVTVDHLLVSCVLAFVVNYLLTPFSDGLERRGVAHLTAVLIPFLSTGLLIFLTIYALVPLLFDQAAAFGGQLPKYQQSIVHLISSSESRLRVLLKLPEISLTGNVNSWIVNRTAELSVELPAIVSGSLTVLVLTPIFAFFMLYDGRRLSRQLLSMVPNSLFEKSLHLQQQLNDQMGGFIRARILEAAIVGVVVWLGLELVGFPYASLLGLFAGITNLIPYIGPLIGAVPAIAIAIISPEAMVTPSLTGNLLILSAIILIAQLIDMAFIIPLVVARIVNLHPVTVLIVIMMGSQLKGILGMVISIPVASAIKLISQTFYEHLIDFRSSDGAYH